MPPLALAAGRREIPRRLDLDETDLGDSVGDSVVWTRLDVGNRRLANRDDVAWRGARRRGEIRDERFQRRARPILRRPARTEV